MFVSPSAGARARHCEFDSRLTAARLCGKLTRRQIQFYIFISTYLYICKNRAAFGVSSSSTTTICQTLSAISSVCIAQTKKQQQQKRKKMSKHMEEKRSGGVKVEGAREVRQKKREKSEQIVVDDFLLHLHRRLANCWDVFAAVVAVTARLCVYISFKY